MKTTTALTATLLTTLGLLSGSNTAIAQSRAHVDDVAYRLRSQTAGLVRDVRVYLRHTPEFRHVYSDAVQMYRLADHVHEMMHSPVTRRHIAADVEQLDELSHHIEDVVDDMDHGFDPDFGDGRGHIHIELGGRVVFHGGGSHGFHDGGSHGSRRPDAHVRMIKRRLNAIEDTLHHLMDDVN